MRNTVAMSVLLGLLLVAGASLASPIGDASSQAVAERVKKEVANFKSFMPTGAPTMGLPVLDPLFEPVINMTGETPRWQATGTLNDLNLNGLSTFTLVDAVQTSGDDKSGRVSISLTFGDVNGDTGYDLHGKLVLGPIPIPVDGKSHASGKMDGIKGSADVDVTINSDNSITINEISNVQYSFSSAKVHVDAFNGIVNALLNKLIPKLVELNRSKLNNLVQTKGKDYIQKYFDIEAGKIPSASHVSASHTLTHLLDNIVVSKEAEEIIREILQHIN